MPRSTVVSALAAVLVLTACGSGSEDPAPSAAPVSSSAAPTASPSPSTSSPAARPGTGPDTTAPDGPLYVALGDSLAAGYQPGGAELRDSAYPALTAARLGRSGDALGVANLACSGETTGTFLEGGKCTYPEKTQMAQAESLLKARRGDVRLVTIDLGGNDLLRCAARLSVDAKCAATGLGTIEKNLPTIVSRLRAAAGPDVPVLVLGYYNPWLASSYLGAGQAQLKVATQAFSDLSTTIAGAAKGSGGRFVSLDAAFALDDDTPTTFNGRSVPKNVAQVCSLTYICTAFDIHLTDEGAAVVGRVLADAATKAGVG